ncbi:MAG: AraC family transcriptional regulator [Cellulosilyticaceae bacterium]
MLTTNTAIDDYNPHILFVTHCISSKETKNKTCYHCHDFVELSIVTSGQISYLIEGKSYLLKEGDVMIFNPNVYHQEFPSISSSSTQLHIGISKLFIDCSNQPNFIKHIDESPILTLTKYKEEFLSCCKEVEKEQRLRQLGHTFLLKSLVMKLIILLYREMDTETTPPTFDSLTFDCRDKQTTVQAIIDYMSMYYMNDISLDYISKSMYLSPIYISKLFKEETGSSPINYLIQIRLNKAKELLQTQNLPIKSIAKSVGYEDAYHFSKLFKKYFGISPSKITSINNKISLDD